MRLDFGGLVIVERIDDLEDVVMKIGGSNNGFEDEMLGLRSECEEILIVDSVSVWKRGFLKDVGCGVVTVCEVCVNGVVII